MLLSDAQRLKELRGHWAEIETNMLSALAKAAMDHPRLEEEQKSKWIFSTTHKEVQYLLKRSRNSKTSALMYERKINQFDHMKKPREEMGKIFWRYIDLHNDNNIDDQKQNLLRKQKVEMKTNQIQCTTFSVNWNEKGIVEDEHQEYLKLFAE